MKNYSDREIMLAEILADIHAKTLTPFFDGYSNVGEYKNSEYFHSLKFKSKDENTVDKTFFLEMAKFFDAEINKNITIEDLSRLVSNVALYCLKGFYDDGYDLFMYDETDEFDEHPKNMSKVKYREISQYILDRIKQKEKS